MELKYLDFLNQCIKNTQDPDYKRALETHKSHLEEFFRQKELGLPVRLENFIDNDLWAKAHEKKFLWGEHTTLDEFLYWFWEELPFITNKKLEVINKDTLETISITDIPLNTVVKPNYDFREIVVELQGQLYFLKSSVSLFDLTVINVTQQLWENDYALHSNF